MKDQYDVIVAGAGLAGVCAAAAAAKAGAETLLLERNTFAGGIATACVEPCPCNYFINPQHQQVVGGNPAEFVDRLVKLGAASPHWMKHRGHVIFDVEKGKVALDEMIGEAGCEVLYDTIVAEALVEEKHLNELKVANRSGIQKVKAKCYVDATGDADVAASARVPLNINPNAHSFVFQLGNVNFDELIGYFRDHPEEHFTDHDIGLSLEESLAFYEETGRWQQHHFAAKEMRLVQDRIVAGDYEEKWGDFIHLDAFQLHGIRDTGVLTVNTGMFHLDEPDAEKITHFLVTGRKMAYYAADFMKKHYPGCQNSFIVNLANDLGLRRTRFIDSEFIMTREIYDQAPQFEDAVGRGVLVTKSPLHITDRFYDIPLRCLLPKGIDNLIIGSGRSAGCEPAELLRVMPATMIVGQGAGTTAAVAANSGVAIPNVDIQAVQDELRRQGAQRDSASSLAGFSI